MPIGVGALWAMSKWVPTVEKPMSRYGPTLSDAVFSMRAIIEGVANTGRSPLPTVEARFPSSTVTDCAPLIPVLSMLRNTSDG